MSARLSSPHGRRHASKNGDATTGASVLGKPTWELIRDYFRARYAPGFKVGDAIYSGKELREVRRQEACASLPPELITTLCTASDYPRYQSGEVKGPDTAPGHYRKWAGTAWVGLLDELPDEDTAELGTAAIDLAADVFRRLIRDALLTMVVINQEILPGIRGNEGLAPKMERRPLIDWCRRWAKPGRWDDIRGYKCWCKAVQQPSGELVCKVAIRHELFAQLKTDRRLTEMTSNKFAARCQRYGIGKPGGQDERPHGKWVMILADDFVSALIASGLADDVEDMPGMPTQLFETSSGDELPD